ncbi:MAG: hypothetical protein US30_C0011G0015 [Candidatus Moranbacteria bacterium GW2011_GWF2_36_839]|nr:MAG: hypothetical protein US27_C0011G0030 [Candidatus Moranbacteria bacterium GW2011_GWF1_36_78]KKQ16784.1 MAG: hypothetical protein US30_C0011G0015 [Candidatus Moranbacteria bacterium GW2011_GWF2_36_839]
MPFLLIVQIVAVIVAIIGAVLYFLADYKNRKEEKEWRRKNGS